MLNVLSSLHLLLQANTSVELHASFGNFRAFYYVLIEAQALKVTQGFNHFRVIFTKQALSKFAIGFRCIFAKL